MLNTERRVCVTDEILYKNRNEETYIAIRLSVTRLLNKNNEMTLDSRKILGNEAGSYQFSRVFHSNATFSLTQVYRKWERDCVRVKYLQINMLWLGRLNKNHTVNKVINRCVSMIIGIKKLSSCWLFKKLVWYDFLSAMQICLNCDF